jgi:NAD(P)-dependent dehydrogenase (short-subunit alcohol dehydrogenase family)
MVEHTVESLGGIDILVNNAALTDPEHAGGFLLDTPFERFDRVMHVNVTGQLICARACVPSMISRGGGKIINQSSDAAFGGSTDETFRPYAISKLALIGLTAGLARELGKHNINVNAIAPGLVLTEIAASSVPEAAKEKILGATPIGRLGRPSDLAGALVFLASPSSDWITGQTLSIDGGWIMRT